MHERSKHMLYVLLNFSKYTAASVAKRVERSLRVRKVGVRTPGRVKYLSKGQGSPSVHCPPVCPKGKCFF